MKTTRSFLLLCLLASVTCLQGQSNIRYSRVNILDGNYCPDGKVVKEMKFASNMQCLFLCSEESSCNGVFLHLSEAKCVACSEKFFSNNDSNNSSIGSMYYKRGDQDTALLSVLWLLNQPMNWTNAKTTCEEFGGQLVTVNSKEKNDFLVQNVLSRLNDTLWIGGSGLGGRANTFQWLDGSFVSAGYTNWRNGQPYHPAGQVPVCIEMKSHWNYQWNDNDCKVEFYSMCEWQNN